MKNKEIENLKRIKFKKLTKFIKNIFNFKNI